MGLQSNLLRPGSRWHGARAILKLLECNVTMSVTVTQSNATEEEREEDKELDIKINVCAYVPGISQSL